MQSGKQTTIYLKADELRRIQELCEEHPGLKPHHVFKVALRHLLFGEESDISTNGFQANIEEKNGHQITTVSDEHKTDEQDISHLFENEAEEAKELGTELKYQ